MSEQVHDLSFSPEETAKWRIHFRETQKRFHDFYIELHQISDGNLDPFDQICYESVLALENKSSGNPKESLI